MILQCFLLVVDTATGFQFLVEVSSRDVCCLFPNGDGEGELLAGRDQHLTENQTEMHRRVI